MTTDDRVRSAVIRGVLVALIVVAPRAALAQDAHYWNQQYGPVGELLGGVMVGSAIDLSSTYYNPGGLAVRENPAFLLSVRAAQHERLDLNFGPEHGNSLSGGGLGSAPSLLAGTLPSGWLGERSRLAWSYLTRQRFHVRVLARLSTEWGSLEPSGRFDHESLELLFDQRMSEDWGGVTWSRRLGVGVGVGITQFVGYRSQRTRYELNAQGASVDGRGNAVLVVDELDYDHWRTLTKVGLLVERERLTLGLAVTTPSISLFGSGKSGFTNSVTGDVDDDGRPEAVLEEGYTEGLASEYRSPVSVAAGLSHRFGRSRLHATAEWFGRVAACEVIDSPDDEIGFGTHTQELDSVVNFGIGVSHGFASGLKAYGAFATDFSAADPDSQTTVSLSRWNVYHLTGGVAFSVSSNRFTLGLAYAFGREERAVDLLPAAPDDVVAVPAEGFFRYRRLKLILGYSFGS